jgi:HEAT repeat protein
MLAEARYELAGLAPELDATREALGEAAASLGSRQFQESVDSLYRAGRAALNAGRHADAAAIFARIARQYPRSRYAGDALYWEAFARHRLGDTPNLRTALRALERQQREYPDAAAGSDAAGLATRIRGELARRGDAEQAEQVARVAQAPVPPVAPTPPRSPVPATAPRPPRASGAAVQGCPSEEEDERLMALNALLQMDADLAIPTLRKVLARRDACSELLRRKAVFLVAQSRSAESTDILLEAAKNDPDPEVKQQAVFWMGHVRDEKAVDVLQDLLATSGDAELQERAIFALSQHRSDRAGAALRVYAERQDAPAELRGRAIFWLGQHRGQNSAFLRELYGRLTEEPLKEQVIQSLAQTRDPENGTWLLGIAQAAGEPMELRKRALFWAGQMPVVPLAELTGLYDRVTDREMKEQLIFVYSQRKDSEAVDKMLQIAREDPDTELRRRAIFWLGQSRDPRAVQLLEELINR